MQQTALTDMEKFALGQICEPLLTWFYSHARILPWREEPTAYHVWVSEIMLQQTRVEAVKPYYERFMQALPDVKSLAEADEETLLKLWEGLGYYNRVRNLNKAAKKIMEQYGGRIPDNSRELCTLAGIGSYTAGAVASIAYGEAVPAVDGNVLRVLSRVRMDERDILQAKVKKSVEEDLQAIMPKDRPGDFNQALMELGATVCIPNGEPRCMECPWQDFCKAHLAGCMTAYPKKAPKKKRVIEHKTVIVLQDDRKAALQKRPEKGLLAGMYEFPWLAGEKTEKEVLQYVKEQGFSPLHIQKLEAAKHIFTHKEWHMTGYAVRVDELERPDVTKTPFVFADSHMTQEKYPIPSAYAPYASYLQIRIGNEKYEKQENEKGIET